MRFFYFLVVVFISYPMYSQSHDRLDTISDVEIYLFEELCNNSSSFYKLNKNKQEELLNNYNALKDFPIKYCPDYINVEKCNLQKEPFLLGSDIESFNWNTKTLILSETGMSKLLAVKFEYFGIPFTLKVKGEEILNAWFWSFGSSQVCFRVYGQLIPGSNSITLKFSKGFGCGPNPLNDQNITTKILFLQNQE